MNGMDRVCSSMTFNQQEFRSLNSTVLKYKILEDLQYADSYYDCLSRVFAMLKKEERALQPLEPQQLRNEFLHQAAKQFVMLKHSKLRHSKLLRHVRLTPKGLVQVVSSSEERTLEHVDFVPLIEMADQVPKHSFRLTFLTKKKELKLVFTQTREDARRIRDFCIALGALNEIKYNLPGFLQFLARRQQKLGTTHFARKLHIEGQKPGYRDYYMRSLKGEQGTSFDFIQESSIKEPEEDLEQMSNQMAQSYLRSLFEELVGQITQDEQKKQQFQSAQGSFSENSASLSSSYSSRTQQFEQTRDNLQLTQRTVWMDYNKYFEK